MVWATLLLQSYLEGARLKVRTERDSFQWIINLTDGSKQLQRWRMRLSLLKCDVMHWAGNKQQTADALSPLLTEGHDSTYLNNMLLVLTIAPAENAEDAKCSCGECHIYHETIEAIASGHPGFRDCNFIKLTYLAHNSRVHHQTGQGPTCLPIRINR